MSFRLKTILGIGAIETVLLALLVWTSLDFLAQSNDTQLVERAQTTARLFATTATDAVLSTDLATLESFVQEMLNNPGLVYARVASATHGVLAQGGDDEALDFPFRADLHITDVDDGVFDTRAPITVGGEVYGHVDVGISTAHVEAVLGAARERMAVIALVEIVLVAIFSFVLGAWLTRQLNELRAGARRIAAGDLSARIRIDSNDELGQVARAFNRMMTRLAEIDRARLRDHEQLERLNVDLEARVSRRTARLEDANTALREANDRIRSTQAQLLQQEKLASIGQLAAGVAHEINNPIAFVGSNIQTLGECTDGLLELLAVYDEVAARLPADDPLAARVADLRRRVDVEFLREDLPQLVSESRSGIDRVREIVRNLRDFSRSDGGVWQEADLHAELDTTLTIAHNEIKYRATVVREYGDLPPITCIPSQLDQVFMNLLVNAAHAIDGDGGRITVRTGREGDGVFVEVEDTGCGMTEDVMHQIFDPFYTTKPVGKGTGLGLSISYGIVQTHHGHLDVRSRPGEGTCFHVWLPIVQPEVKAAAPADYLADTGEHAA